MKHRLHKFTLFQLRTGKKNAGRTTWQSLHFSGTTQYINALTGFNSGHLPNRSLGSAIPTFRHMGIYGGLHVRLALHKNADSPLDHKRKCTVWDVSASKASPPSFKVLAGFFLLPGFNDHGIVAILVKSVQFKWETIKIHIAPFAYIDPRMAGLAFLCHWNSPFFLDSQISSRCQSASIESRGSYLSPQFLHFIRNQAPCNLGTKRYGIPGSRPRALSSHIHK